MFQSKNICAKSAVVDPEKLWLFLSANFSDVRMISVSHPSEGTTPQHWHYVVMFRDVTRWASVRGFLMDSDPHSYSDSCRSLSRSIRYLLHLDHPEKVRVSRSNLRFFGGIDSEAIEPYLYGSQEQPVSLLLRDIARMDACTSLQYCIEHRIDIAQIRRYMDYLLTFERWYGSRSHSALVHSVEPRLDDSVHSEEPSFDDLVHSEEPSFDDLNSGFFD